MDTSALLKSVPTGLWIGGEERQGTSTFSVLDPSDDEVLATVADATADDARDALDAACASGDRPVSMSTALSRAGDSVPQVS